MTQNPMEAATAFVLGLVLLFILVKILYAPIRLALKLFVNAFLGGALLVFLNLVLKIFGISIGVNFVTAIVTGVLGVPGISLLLFLQIILNV